MSRYIDADKLERDLKYRYEQLEKEYGCYDSYVEAIDECIDKVENAPTADVQEVRHGKWVEDNDGVTRCSRCGSKANRNYYVNVQELSKFCHMCGAKMDLE